MSLQQKLSKAYEKFTIDQEKQHHIYAADLIPSKLFKNSLDVDNAIMANLFENLHSHLK